ncbi:hypothetical protein [Microbacterium xylanilyticum]
MPRSARLALSAGYAFLGLVFLLCAAWGIGEAVDASRPVQWGTFTQLSCESTKSGCRPIGSWTSDDGSRKLDGVVLAGSTGPVEMARAGYRDGATAMAGDRIVVRTDAGFSDAAWLPWAVCAVTVLLGILLTWIYRSRRVDPGAPPDGTVPRAGIF